MLETSAFKSYYQVAYLTFHFKQTVGGVISQCKIQLVMYSIVHIKVMQAKYARAAQQHLQKSLCNRHEQTVK